jgi:hypothetical protein
MGKHLSKLVSIRHLLASRANERYKQQQRQEPNENQTRTQIVQISNHLAAAAAVFSYHFRIWKDFFFLGARTHFDLFYHRQPEDFLLLLYKKLLIHS